LLLPGYVEHRAEDKLTEGGGSARVSVDALPAVRLLAGDGDRIEIEGSDLRLDLVAQGTKALENLDGFDQVGARLVDLTAGPFDVRTLRLRRPEGADLYRLTLHGEASVRGLADYAAGSIGSALTDLAGSAGFDLGRRVPVDLDLEIASDGGRPRVVSGGSTVAGYPADLVVDALTGAIAGPL